MFNYHLIAFTVAGALVLILTPVVRHIGLVTGQLDRPNHRKIHRSPIVRIGGVAICLSTCIALLVTWSLGGRTLSPQTGEFLAVVTGAFVFFLIGLADDLFNLPALPRLLVQTSVASVVWLVGVQIDVISLPSVGTISLGLLSLPVTVIWLVGVVNAINWIDGMDGLAGGVAGIAAAIAAVVCLSLNQPLAVLIAAALAGSTLGFLRYNFNPAIIFMGDGGSYFIGFTLAGVAVIGVVKTAALTAVLLPYLILAVPIVDMLAVIVARLKHGKSPFISDQRHLHHRLLQAGMPVKLAVCLVYALTFWCGSLAMCLAGIHGSLALIFSATVLLSYIGWQAWKTIAVEYINSQEY